MAESKSNIKEKSSPTLQKVFAVVFAIIGSLDSILILAQFIQQNVQLLIAFFIIATVMIGIAFFMYKRQLQRILIIFFGTSLIALIPLWIWIANTEIEKIDVTVTDPKNNEIVTMRYIVKGRVSDSDAQVYVLVHPLATREIWVQNFSIIGLDGEWQTTCFFGTETLGIDEQYEVIALAIKENSLVNIATGNYLTVGQTLKMLPKKNNRSNLVTVSRPK